MDRYTRTVPHQTPLSAHDLEDRTCGATTNIVISMPSVEHERPKFCTGFIVAVDLVATCAHSVRDWVILKKIPLDKYSKVKLIGRHIEVRCRRYDLKSADAENLESLQEVYLLQINKKADEEARGEKRDLKEVGSSNIYYTRKALDDVFINFKFGHLVRSGSDANLEVSIPLSRFFSDPYSTLEEPLHPPFVLYDKYHDVALIQLKADDAQWQIRPLPLAMGWRTEDRLWLCGCPGGRQDQRFIPGKVGMSLVDLRLDHNTENAAVFSTGFAFASAVSLQSSTIAGFSGGPVVTEDGLCIGIEVGRIPPQDKPAGVGSEFDTLLVTPSVHVQRLMEHRLALTYRSAVYNAAILALREKARLPVLNTSIIIYAPEVRRQIKRAIRALEKMDERLRLKLMEGPPSPSTDLIIIGLSQGGTQSTTDYLNSLDDALGVHVQDNVVLVSFQVSSIYARSRHILPHSFDVSEPKPIEGYPEQEQLAALTRVVLRIHQLFEDHRYEGASR